MGKFCFHIFIMVSLLCACLEVRAQESASDAQREAVSIPFTVVEYNVENLFDCRHDSLKDDYEFLPDAERRWTFGRYRKKLNDIGRVIHQCGGKGKEWRLPDIVALTEVENDSTLYMLTRRSMLGSADYRFFITNSADVRGVDVALLYNPLTFRPISHCPIRVTLPAKVRPTRDILYVNGIVRSGDTLHIFIVHAPSRSGGQAATQPYRIAVARKLVEAMDSIRTRTNNPHIIVAGDFNDYTGDKSLDIIESNGLTDVSANAKGLNNKKITGTYKFQRVWESLDHIFLSPILREKTIRCFIHDAPWMLKKDASGGRKPYRTYLGTHYDAGISDHLPLVLQMEL